MTTTICVQYDQPFAGVAALTLPVMQEYCERHGYRLHAVADAPVWRSIVWDRFYHILNVMDYSDVVVHMDADVLITNLTKPLPECENIVICENYREDGSRWLNDGVCLFRSSEQLRWLLNAVIKCPDGDGIYCGQDVLQRFYAGGFHHLFDTPPQNRLNSFLYTEYGMAADTPGHWQPGDFVLHLPGRTNARRVEIFTEKLKEVVR